MVGDVPYDPNDYDPRDETRFGLSEKLYLRRNEGRLERFCTNGPPSSVSFCFVDQPKEKKINETRRFRFSPELTEQTEAGLILKP